MEEIPIVSAGLELAAVCGLYCGACTLYRALQDIDRKDKDATLRQIAERRRVSVAQLRCEGCLAADNLNPACADCKIRTCAASRPDVTRCSDCADFPCEMITRFSNDGVPHHGSVLKNIRRQQKLGVREWAEEEYERIRCQYCGVSLDWYAAVCHRCGTKNASSITSALGERLQPHYRA